MKIGDRIIVDKEYYMKKYRETFGNDIEIDGLTNDNTINTCLIRAIKNEDYLLITDIDNDEHDEEFIHFKDYEGYECCIKSKYIKIKEIMIEKLKEKITFVNIKEVEDINKPQTIIYVVGEDKFQKTVTCGEYDYTQSENDILDSIKDQVIDKIINTSTNTDKSIDEAFEELIKNRKDNGRLNNETFVIAPEDCITNYNAKHIIKTDKLKTEFIVGVKTDINEPGVVIMTNEEGLSNPEKIKYAITDLGFFPEKSYLKLKFKQAKISKDEQLLKLNKYIKKYKGKNDDYVKQLEYLADHINDIEYDEIINDISSWSDSVDFICVHQVAYNAFYLYYWDSEFDTLFTKEIKIKK